MSDLVVLCRTRSDSVGFGQIQSDSVGFGQIWSDLVGLCGTVEPKNALGLPLYLAFVMQFIINKQLKFDN